MTECPSVLPCCPLRGIYLLGGFAASGFCEKSRGEVRSTDQNKMLRSSNQAKRKGTVSRTCKGGLPPFACGENTL
jgi:hypothetical protein